MNIGVLKTIDNISEITVEITVYKKRNKYIMKIHTVHKFMNVKKLLKLD